MNFLFPWLDFFFSLDRRSACLALAYGLGKTTDLPLVLGKKVQPRKKSSSLVSFLYRPNNVLETEYILSTRHIQKETENQIEKCIEFVGVFVIQVLEFQASSLNRFI